MINRPKHNVLLVDDEAVIGYLLAEGLSKSVDCNVETAVTGQEALEKMAAQEFLLVVTDYKMPKMNGLQLSETIRARYPRTKIVLMTAYDTESIRETAEESGVRDFLKKPVDLSKFREFIQNVIDEANQVRL